MRELVRGYATATFESASEHGSLDDVVKDLATFSRALGASDSLRQVLTDNTIPTMSRRDVVIDLLTQNAAPETTALISFVVRVERAADIPLAIDGVVVLADTFIRQRGNALSATEGRPERSAVRDRIRGYAERLLQELGAMNEVDAVEDELFRFARLLDDNLNLRRVLQDVNASFSGRMAIVSDLLSGKVRPTTMRLVSYVLRAGRTRDIVGTFEWLVDLAAQERGRRLAEVRSAVDLDEAEQDRLAVALSHLVERTVEVRVIHDPRVIGGVHITVGDLVIDGTVRIRFERLRDLLAQAS